MQGSDSLEFDQARQRRLSCLASADAKALVQFWSDLDIDPTFEVVRGPEYGLVGLRGCVGGAGSKFNFGEASATRASVRLENGSVGHSMVLGRDKTKAKLAAVIDALCQAGEHVEQIDQLVIKPLSRKQQLRDEKRAAETAATKVDFFTMVRGDPDD